MTSSTSSIVRTFAVGAAASLALIACGGGDDESGPQKELADAAVALLGDFAEADGIEVDEGCVRDLIGELSDADAEAGLEALQNPDSDSEAFDAVGERIEAQCFS